MYSKRISAGADSVSLLNIAFCSLHVGKTRQADQKAISLSSLSFCWTQFMAGFDRKRSKASSCQKAPVHKANGRWSSQSAFNLATDPLKGPHLELRPSLNQTKVTFAIAIFLKINEQKRARLSKSPDFKIFSLMAGGIDN